MLVLGYHAVSPTWSVTLSVAPDDLERQLTWLARNGWRGVTFRDAVLNRPSGKTLVVTFDDAFVSVLTLAYPILSALGLRATVFAPTAFMGSRQRLAWDGIDQWENTPELEGMSWEDLGVLQDAGWEIGSHTRTHPHLTRLGDEELRTELAESRAEITRHLGRSCQTIAYPYGDVDDRVAENAGAAGYAAGAAMAHELTDLGPHRWPRIGVYHGDPMWRFRVKASRTTRRVRASATWSRVYARASRLRW
jgi:peptidoglycan/xylan/chitin deacetylase (PgdA/CDA1 family)